MNDIILINDAIKKHKELLEYYDAMGCKDDVLVQERHIVWLSELREYKEARNAEKRNFPDILYIDGVGWVKKLPCAPDASVFVAYITTTYKSGKKREHYLHRVSVSCWSDWCKKEHQGEYTIEKVQMRPAWYNKIGKTIFLTEDEARTKIQEYLERVE